jgi:hypothetical protein
VTARVPLGYDRRTDGSSYAKETCAMGDKNPKNAAKSNKQKTQKKDAKPAKK